MLFLVLGRGKTGSFVAEVAAERGHSVQVVGEEANRDGSAITSAFLAKFDAIIDFTTPEAVVSNMRACLATGAKMVVGTTGWYDKLDRARELVERKQAGLLYGTNFSIGVQVMLQTAKQMGTLLKDAGYEFSIEETHHVTKLDSPSGTAISLAEVVKKATGKDVPVHAERVGDAAGTHVLVAKSDSDKLVLTHESYSRRGFAEGAVRAAEWLSSRTGCYDFQDVYTEM